MMFYAMLCTFTMSIVEVIVHDKVPGMKYYPIVHFEGPSSFIEFPSSFFFQIKQQRNPWMILHGILHQKPRSIQNMES